MGFHPRIIRTHRLACSVSETRTRVAGALSYRGKAKATVFAGPATRGSPWHSFGGGWL